MVPTAREREKQVDRILRQLQEVSKELWLLLTMFVILGLVNFLVASDHVLLGLYTLPVVFSGYCYGRRHATMTALGSVCLVIPVAHYNARLFSQTPTGIPGERWFEIAAWGGTLILVAYAMGTLYERMRNGMAELRQTYFGVLIAWAQEVERYCDQTGQDYNEINSFWEEIKYLPPVKFFSGIIGGHCVMPNIKILSEFNQSVILQAIQGSNNLKVQREAGRKDVETLAANKRG